MVQNVFSPFTEAPEGLPLAITATSSPGTLIHTTTNLNDSIWLRVGLDDDVPYTQTVWLRIVKGNSTLGYVEDAPIKIAAGATEFIEQGIILTGTAELRAYIDTTLSTATPTPNVIATGYVHRRI